MKRILKYLKHTTNVGLTINKSSSLLVSGFSDVVWTGIYWWVCYTFGANIMVCSKLDDSVGVKY